jgi:serine protease inhibitor
LPGSTEEPASTSTSELAPPPREPFSDDNNDFAFALYGHLREELGNLFVSPLSIRTVLVMVEAGASAETAAQMKEALRISSTGESHHVAYAKAMRRLRPAGAASCEFEVASSVWGQDGAPLRSEFTDLMSRYYDGNVTLVDFVRAAGQARVSINQWAADKTRRKIQNLLPHGGVDAETRMVLVNAVYFNGKWQHPFKTSDTLDQPFHLESGGTVQVPLMQQQARCQYMQCAGYQAVDLGYRGSDLSMLVLLPDRRDGLRDLETTITSQILRDCVKGFNTREVKVHLPRFQISWGTVDITAQLIAPGMPLAFSRSSADYSGINGYQAPEERSLALSAVFHKAFVDVNEEGTQAAAATAASMAGGGTFEPPPTFRADHPFLLAIRDRWSGAVLFLGRVADPSRES